MLDSRRDCRYRGGANRNIGVGLGKVTFHNMLGTSFGVPGFPLTLIHPSAWNWRSANFAFWGFCEVRHDRVLRSWSFLQSPSCGMLATAANRRPRDPRACASLQGAALA